LRPAAWSFSLLGKIKEAENTQSAVTAAYQQLVEEAK